MCPSMEKESCLPQERNNDRAAIDAAAAVLDVLQFLILSFGLFALCSRYAVANVDYIIGEDKISVLAGDAGPDTESHNLGHTFR